MNSFTLKIKWRETKEVIFLDLSENLQIGDVLTTYEHWEDYLDPTEYLADVTFIKNNGSRYEIELTYSAENNPHILASSAVWGVVTLIVDFEKLRASAEWKSNPSDPELDGPTTVEVDKNGPLFEDLGFVAAQRRKRRQAQLRRALMQESSRCEITGESALSSLEAAHIVEVKTTGGYTASNGILLRADLHRLFDSGALAINLDGSITLNHLVPEDSDYRKESHSWKISNYTLSRISNALQYRNQNIVSQ